MRHIDNRELVKAGEAGTAPRAQTAVRFDVPVIVNEQRCITRCRVCIDSCPVPEHAPKLLPLLEDAVADVRRAAAGALGKLQAGFAAGHLERLLQDRDSEVVKAARRALAAAARAKVDAI